MPVILKAAKSLPKSLTDMIAPTINEDPISTFASEIQKVNSRTEVDKIVKGLADANGFDLFRLGGAVVRAQELFTTKQLEFEGYKSFRQYIEEGHGIRYGKAMHAARIYRELLDLNLPWSAFGSIGWTKVRLVLDVVTKDNVGQWVANAKAMNFPSLKALVEAEKHKGEPEKEHGPKTITTKSFKLHADQKSSWSRMGSRRRARRPAPRSITKTSKRSSRAISVLASCSPTSNTQWLMPQSTLTIRRRLSKSRSRGCNTCSRSSTSPSRSPGRKLQ